MRKVSFFIYWGSAETPRFPDVTYTPTLLSWKSFKLYPLRFPQLNSSLGVHRLYTGPGTTTVGIGMGNPEMSDGHDPVLVTVMVVRLRSGVGHGGGTNVGLGEQAR